MPEHIEPEEYIDAATGQPITAVQWARYEWVSIFSHGDDPRRPRFVRGQLRIVDGDEYPFTSIDNA